MITFENVQDEINKVKDPFKPSKLSDNELENRYHLFYNKPQHLGIRRVKARLSRHVIINQMWDDYEYFDSGSVHSELDSLNYDKITFNKAWKKTAKKSILAKWVKEKYTDFLNREDVTSEDIFFYKDNGKLYKNRFQRLPKGINKRINALTNLLYKDYLTWLSEYLQKRILSNTVGIKFNNFQDFFIAICTAYKSGIREIKVGYDTYSLNKITLKIITDLWANNTYESYLVYDRHSKKKAYFIGGYNRNFKQDNNYNTNYTFCQHASFYKNSDIIHIDNSISQPELRQIKKITGADLELSSLKVKLNNGCWVDLPRYYKAKFLGEKHELLKRAKNLVKNRAKTFKTTLKQVQPSINEDATNKGFWETIIKLLHYPKSDERNLIKAYDKPNKGIKILENTLGMKSENKRLYLESPDLPDVIQISGNVTDKLFCSTGQNFCSCFNLESRYNYNGGLPLFAENNHIIMVSFGRNTFHKKWWWKGNSVSDGTISTGGLPFKIKAKPPKFDTRFLVYVCKKGSEYYFQVGRGYGDNIGELYHYLVEFFHLIGLKSHKRGGNININTYRPYLQRDNSNFLPYFDDLIIDEYINDAIGFNKPFSATFDKSCGRTQHSIRSNIQLMIKRLIFLKKIYTSQYPINFKNILKDNPNIKIDTDCIKSYNGRSTWNFDNNEYIWNIDDIKMVFGDDFYKEFMKEYAKNLESSKEECKTPDDELYQILTERESPPVAMAV